MTIEVIQKKVGIVKEEIVEVVVVAVIVAQAVIVVEEEDEQAFMDRNNEIGIVYQKDHHKNA
jgi:hypothetical protein